MADGRVVIDVDLNSQDAEKEAEKLGDGLLGKISPGTVAIGAAATAAVKVIKDISVQAAKSYADMEQLEGGVETLFGKDAQTVLKNADSAFKTAGMNANSYMETVTSSAAAMINSLNGDTTAAAEKSDMAVRDMADNANKMGSTMESIRTAYSGFSRGQFQLLDNLKLGYGGTKTEMERLLADAERLKAAQGEYAEYSIDSYADIVDAIHVVQTEMGITGTTAKEASETISGSIASAKSAWENLVTGIADPNADIGQLIGDMFSAAHDVANNVIPLIENIALGAVKTIGTAITDTLGITGTIASDLEEAMGKADEALSNSTAHTEAAAIQAKAYADRLKELEAAGLDTAEAQGEYRAIVERLNGVMPGLNLKINEQTGRINQNTAAIYSNIEALKREAEMQAQYDWYVEKIRAYTEAQAELSAKKIEASLAEDDYKAHLEASTTATEALADALGISAEQAYIQAMAFPEAAKAAAEKVGADAALVAVIKEEAQAATESYVQMQALNGEVEEGQTLADGYAGEVKLWGQALNDLTGQLDSTAGATGSLTGEITEATEQSTAWYESMHEVYVKAKDDAMASINAQIGLFEKMSVSVDTSVADMIESLESQIDYMDQYADNIRRAAELGINEGLLAYLTDGSKESAEILAAIVADGGENMEALNEKFGLVEKGKDAFAETIAELQINFDEQTKEMIKNFGEKIQELDQSEQAYEIGVNDIDGLIRGARSKESELTAEYARLGRIAWGAYRAEMKQASPSKRMIESSANDVRGLVKGAKDNRGELGEAYKELADTAFDAYSGGLSSLLAYAGNMVALNQSAVGASLNPGAAVPAQPIIVREKPDNRTQSVNIEFTGSLAQLGRVLQPVIRTETDRLGSDLVTE